MSGVGTVLLLNAAALLAAILALWAYSIRIRDVSFIDAFWAFGMVLLAWATWAQSGQPGARSHLLLGLTTLWGLRLSWHLWTRWRAHGEDPRYEKIMRARMEKTGWSWAKTSLLAVFLTQAPLLFITCLPAQLGIMASGEPAPIGLLGWAGLALWLTGMVFETVGDAQLTAFRADPASKGKVLDTGLWRYTRHPNYFGDTCVWWGIWLVAAETGGWIAAVSVVGPLFLTYTLTKWSGKPLLEKGLVKNRPGYADYVARTSGFIPWPPKKG